MSKVPPSTPRLQANGGETMTNRHMAGTKRPPGRDGGTGSRVSRAAQFTPHHGNAPLAPTTVRTGVHGRFIASADRPPTMPIPDTETQTKVRWPTSMREPTSLGGSGASGGQKESQKNRIGAAEHRPTTPCSDSAITHNRRLTKAYSTPSSALIIPWSCVRITPGLLRL